MAANNWWKHGKWSCKWIPRVGVLLSLFAIITAQPSGFLSIRCGSKTNYTDENNITWVTDADYIDVGETADIGNVTEEAYGSPLDSLRLFPTPLQKSCYQLPVPLIMRPYLLRLWFAIGNYSGFQTLPSFAYSFEAVDMLDVANITAIHGKEGLCYEKILVTSGAVMYLCLIRTSAGDNPFISGIELRPLQDGMYAQAKPGTLLHLNERIDFGGNSTVRYPHDIFDRIWTADSSNGNSVRSVSSEKNISITNTKELPPTAVMQTALVANGVDNLHFDFLSAFQGRKSLLLLYFAEIETINMSESRSFYVTINDGRRSENITLLQNYSAVEVPFVSNQSDYFYLWEAANSTRPPIINAGEYYLLHDTQPATYLQDIEALHAIKKNFSIKDWISDPCYLIPWKGIGCDNISSAIRISEIDLSGRSLTGSLPKDIEQLTAIVSVSFANNDLTGPLPNFSSLIMLERLYLQNNNLNGTVPDWLSKLKNLKELNIENNNFSGVIPAGHLLNCSLKFSYSGNQYLRMDKRECAPPSSIKNKLNVILGTTFSGILIIALALSNKLRRKKQDAAKEGDDYSAIIVPNTTNCRAFTLEEIVTATQNYNRKIGEGGFGSVFLGKLPEGNNIAVKVLSLFSRQGADEFLNEVDLLSRINHRNLVSLLGYCNETREVMLVYEYMSGGSLRDHLYGSSAEESQLSWKTRLKIALDAAQGMEYLHVGSTPKIIHRDIKTSNILLDQNFNGKLADFGLSRMTMDGEATHVTTAVKGTAGYVDPEYFKTQMLTEKSDVYSFGVVLLEMICGRQPIDVKLPLDEVNIIRWVTSFVLDMVENPGKLIQIVDKRLDGSYDLKSITRVVKVAMRSVQDEPSSRPSMTEVVGELKRAMEIEGKASVSIREEIDIESGRLCSHQIHLSMDSSEQKGMKWSDNRSNSSTVGR